MDIIKVFNIIVILCIVLMVQDTEARSLRKTSGHHRHFNQDTSEISKQHSAKRGMKSHHKIETLLNRLIDIEAENSETTKNNRHHPLRKRHENSGIPIEHMSEETLKELDFETARDKPDETFEVQVKKVENTSSCNYTVTYFDNSGEYILPKNLVNITCKEKGAKCREDGEACCLQTYTYIQVPRKNSGETVPMRINTGCVCAFQSSSELRGITQPHIDSP